MSKKAQHALISSLSIPIVCLKSMSNTKNSLKKFNIRLKFMSDTKNSLKKLNIRLKSMSDIFLLDHQHIHDQPSTYS